ncbi:MAG: glycosyltransferase family 2 protein [Candidatus Aminicenantes bacterium]|nr:MAG: glycosyltransferase family 2 protein [Candidatus Aminicenantes bacterium]
MNNIDLTVSIVNHNTKDLLENCLNSVYQKTKKIKSEVIVVDNGSSDGSIEMIRRKFPQVKLIENNENVGFSKATNRGIEMSPSRYVLLLNSDTILLDSLNEVLIYADNNLQVGAIGCKLIYPDGSIQPSASRFITLEDEILRTFRMGQYGKRPELRDFMIKYLGRLLGESVNTYLLTCEGKCDICQVDWVSGACLLVRRRVIDEIGLLDENFFAYYEDIDWCRRMRKAGWKIIYYPAVKVIHLTGESTQQSEKNNIYHSLIHYQSKFYYHKKYKGGLAVIILKNIIIAKGLLMVFLFPTFCLLGKSKEVLAELRILCKSIVLKV